MREEGGGKRSTGRPGAGSLPEFSLSGNTGGTKAVVRESRPVVGVGGGDVTGTQLWSTGMEVRPRSAGEDD